MSDRTTPPSPWAKLVAGAEHPAVRDPALWSAVASAVDALAATPGGETARDAMSVMLADSVASVALADAIADLRARLEYRAPARPKMIAPEVSARADEAARDAHRLVDDLLSAARFWADRDGCPHMSEVGAAGQAFEDAARRLAYLARQVADAAPAGRGPAPKAARAAREDFAVEVARAYRDVHPWRIVDDAFWPVLRAIYEAATGEPEIPDEPALRQKIRKIF